MRQCCTRPYADRGSLYSTSSTSQSASSSSTDETHDTDGTRRRSSASALFSMAEAGRLQLWTTMAGTATGSTGESTSAASRDRKAEERETEGDTSTMSTESASSGLDSSFGAARSSMIARPRGFVPVVRIGITGADAGIETLCETGILYSWPGVHSGVRVPLTFSSSSEPMRVGLRAHSTSFLLTCSPCRQKLARPSVLQGART